MVMTTGHRDRRPSARPEAHVRPAFRVFFLENGFIQGAGEWTLSQSW